MPHEPKLPSSPLQALILKKVHALPLEKQREVLDFVEFLWLRYGRDSLIEVSQEPSTSAAAQPVFSPPLQPSQHPDSPWAPIDIKAHKRNLEQGSHLLREVQAMTLTTQERAAITSEDIAEAQRELWSLFPGSHEDEG